MFKFRTINSSQSRNNFHIRSEDVFLFPNLAVNLNWFTRWLRKTGFDELPQLFNILLGQMSFVGPRPLMIEDLLILEKEFPKHFKLRDSITSRPGLTGTWQTFGDRTKGIENLIGLDIYYEEEKCFELDLKIFLLTIPIVLFAKNSDAIIPRIKLLSKLFSLSLGEIKFMYTGEASGGQSITEESDRYSITIPTSWCCAKNSSSKHLKYEELSIGSSISSSNIKKKIKDKTQNE